MDTIEQENSKEFLRTRYLDQRRLLGEKEIEIKNLGLLNQVQALDLTKAKTVHTFLPIPRLAEPDTLRIAASLTEKNPLIRWVIGKTERKTCGLYHFVWDERTVMHENKWGICEPLGGVRVPEQEIDLIFVPLLVCDQQGYRVGYGKGYYDRFLAKCRPDALKVGLCFFEPVASIIDRDEFDIPLDVCITPDRTYRIHEERHSV